MKRLALTPELAEAFAAAEEALGGNALASRTLRISGDTLRRIRAKRLASVSVDLITDTLTALRAASTELRAAETRLARAVQSSPALDS